MNSIEQMGLRAFEGQPVVMPRAHVHAEIEINFVSGGAMTYRFGDQVVRLEAGTVCVFWATVPHQLIRVEPDTRFGWLTLPIQDFTGAGLPTDFVSSILRGEVHRNQQSNLTEDRFRGWILEIESSKPELIRATLSEVEALLRRIAAGQHNVAMTPGVMGPVENMCRAMSQGFREPLSIESIADAAGMHPQSAMRLFKRSMGMTIGSYLLKQRLSNVQRLLVETDHSVETVAYESGFRSTSQFYSQYRREMGMPPRTHRQLLRGELTAD